MTKLLSEQENQKPEKMVGSPDQFIKNGGVTPQPPKEQFDSAEVSLCDSCGCMTHTVGNNCGKCGAPKEGYKLGSKLPPKEDTDELRDMNEWYLRFAKETDVIKKFNLFIEWFCPDDFAHLIDSDDNPGQAMRSAINKYALQRCREAEIETARAYGGCTKCYGKGYSTYINGTTMYADFGDEFGGNPFVHSDKLEMRFCTCGRGKQLAELTKKREERHD